MPNDRTTPFPPPLRFLTLHRWSLVALTSLLAAGLALSLNLTASADPQGAATVSTIAAMNLSRAVVGKTRLPADLPVNVVSGTVKTARLAELAGAKATVLLFVGTECPISNKYAPDLFALSRAYAGKGVRFVHVYANHGTAPADALKHAKTYFQKNTLVLDANQALTDAVGATVTPEAVVLDSGRTIRYRGRVDDRFVERGKAKTTGATTSDLRAALDAVLAGKTVKTPLTAAVGCAIERAPKAPTVAAVTGPTYAGEIAGILNQNCVSCHREGEIGPMPLANFEQARKYAANIASVADAKIMPPWKPVEGHGDFTGKRRLTDAQIVALKKWADNGAPAGDLAKTPVAPTFPKGWRLGQPDLVLSMPEKWRVAPSGPDVYRCFVLPTNLMEDKQVVAVEYRAGNKSVVHHVLGYIDTQGLARKKDEADEGAGYTSFGGPGFTPFGEVGGWAPGNLPQFLPEGIGRLLPAGSDIVLQVHYHSDGKPEDDITSVGLYFARKPIEKQLRIIPVAARKLDIPPGEEKYTASQSYPVPIDANLIFVAPHMHLLGRTFEMVVTMPDGTKKPIVKIDDWDFKWQDTYTYKTPMKLPKGATVTLTATYDNSENNPRNPNSPPKRVTWGEETTDEMCIGFLGFVAENENDPLIKLMDGLRRRSRNTGATSGASANRRPPQNLVGRLR